MQDYADDVDDATNDDGDTPTNDLRAVTCNKRTEELAVNVRSPPDVPEMIAINSQYQRTE